MKTAQEAVLKPAPTAVPMCRYRNALPVPNSFAIGTSPDGMPIEYDLDAGEEFDGPLLYKNFFARHNCEPVKQESQEGKAPPQKLKPARGPAAAVASEPAEEAKAEPAKEAEEPKEVAVPDAPIAKPKAKKG